MSSEKNESIRVQKKKRCGFEKMRIFEFREKTVGSRKMRIYGSEKKLGI